MTTKGDRAVSLQMIWVTVATAKFGWLIRDSQSLMSSLAEDFSTSAPRLSPWTVVEQKRSQSEAHGSPDQGLEDILGQLIDIPWMSVACIRTSIACFLNQTGGPRSVDIGETAEAGRPIFRWLGSNVLWPSTSRTRPDARESEPSC